MNSNEIDISSKVHKIIKFGLIGIILLGIAVAGIVWNLESGSDEMVIRDAKVATSMVYLKSQANGAIEEILVQEGDQIEPGTVVAKLKVSVTPEQISQLEQTVELSKKNLAQVMQGTMVNVPVASVSSAPSNSSVVAAAQRKLQRMEQLLEMGAVSVAERDAAAAELAEAEAMAPPPPQALYETRFQPSSPEVIRNAELAVQQAQMALELAKNNAQGTDVVSDVAGTVYLSDLTVGSEVKPGQTILNVGESDSLWVEAYVTLEQKDKISLGELAYCNIDGNKYKGTVMDIILPDNQEKASDVSTDGENPESAGDGEPQKVTVKISIPNDAVSVVRPGQRAEVRLEK